MIIRSSLKQSARQNLSRSYWRSVLASLVISISVGGFSADFITKYIYSWDYGHGNSFWDHIQDALPFAGFHAVVRGDGDPLGILAAIAMFFFGAVIASGIIRLLLRIFVMHPLEVGGKRFFVVNRAQDCKASGSEIIYPFANGYTNVVKTLFLRNLYLFLWSLLFVIPGIVKSYSYRMVPYILAESPEMDQKEAFRLSREMMDGYKWEAFVFDLSFIGWYILDCLTFGILGIFWVDPYKSGADAELYAAIRDHYLGRGPEEEAAA